MFKIIKAFAKAVQAEMQLQDELAKKYPFGYSKTCPEDAFMISEACHQWRRTKSFKNYLKYSPSKVDNIAHCLVSQACPKRYCGAYGVFGSYVGHVVCQHGVDYVYAQNPDEAMDKIYENESKKTLGSDKTYYNDWLLTELTVNNPKAQYGYDVLFRL